VKECKQGERGGEGKGGDEEVFAFVGVYSAGLEPRVHSRLGQTIMHIAVA
jgi:hypothetical protein